MPQMMKMKVCHDMLKIFRNPSAPNGRVVTPPAENGSPMKNASQQPTPCRRRSAMLWRVALVVLSAACLLLLAWTMRIGFRLPFFAGEQDWDGPDFLGALRLYQGKTLYPDPATTGDYYAYGPLPAIVKAALMLVFGPTMVAAKVYGALVLVSLLTAVGFCASALRTKTETTGGGTVHGIAVGVVAAACALAVQTHLLWYIGGIRADLFSTMCALWAFYFLLTGSRGTDGADNSRVRIPVWSVLFVVCAGLGKQNYLLLAPLLLVYAGFAAGGKTMLKCAIWMAVFGLPFVLWFERPSAAGGGEYFFATSQLFRNNLFPHIPEIKANNYLQAMGLALCLFAPLMALGRARLHRLTTNRAAHWMPWIFLLAGYGLGSVSLLKDGGDLNALLLPNSIAAIIAGWGIGLFFEKANLCRRRGILLAGIALLLVMGAVEIRYSGYNQTRREDVYKLRFMKEYIDRNPEEKVLPVGYEYLTALAGRDYEISDALMHCYCVAPELIPSRYRQRIEGQYYDTILIGAAPLRPAAFPELIARHYTLSKTVTDDRGRELFYIYRPTQKTGNAPTP